MPGLQKVSAIEFTSGDFAHFIYLPISWRFMGLLLKMRRPCLICVAFALTALLPR